MIDSWVLLTSSNSVVLISFGGADEQFFYNDIWCYDPQSNKWEAVPAFGVLPTSRQGHATSVVDDIMYIFGGTNHEDQILGDLAAFKFNGKSNSMNSVHMY